MCIRGLSCGSSAIDPLQLPTALGQVLFLQELGPDSIDTMLPTPSKLNGRKLEGFFCATSTELVDMVMKIHPYMTPD